MGIVSRRADPENLTVDQRFGAIRATQYWCRGYQIGKPLNSRLVNGEAVSPALIAATIPAVIG